MAKLLLLTTSPVPTRPLLGRMALWSCNPLRKAALLQQHGSSSSAATATAAASAGHRLPLHLRSPAFVTSRPFTVRASSGSDAPDDRPTVGFLGLGTMGFAMARNLIEAGSPKCSSSVRVACIAPGGHAFLYVSTSSKYDVTVWNRTASKCDTLVNKGAKYGSSPQETTAACDITFAMLSDPAGAIAVALGEDGAVKGLGPQKGYVDVSTVDAETSKAIAKSVKSTGAQFLEAPVSGSKKPAEDGTLIFLTAGDKALYDQASSMFDVMGKSKYFLGEVGRGAAMKLVVNMVMGSMMASFSEGLLLGSKVGLDQETIVQVIGEGAISAPMFSMKGPTMIKGAYPPAFSLKHQQKDLRLALALAEEVSQTIPVAACANELYKRAKIEGHGDSDFSAVIEVLKA